jgi:RNA polymerase sigma-70 factor, ECF subfamily
MEGMKHSFEDAVLIKSALAGEEDGYTGLVERHQATVARVVTRITRRPEWAADLTQEIFLKAFRNLGRFQRQSEFRTWLYRIAVNESLEALRREKAERRYIEPGDWSGPDSLIIPDPDSGERLVLDRELQAEVRQALDRLGPDQRALLTLRYLEELSTPEIARVLDLPEGTVRSRLFYARRDLAALLRPYLDHPRAAEPKRGMDHEV